jgi:hypothetical protein
VAWKSRVKLVDEMPPKTEKKEKETGRTRLPKGVLPLPPVSMGDLKKDTEHDPGGAEEFMALIRALRQPVSHPVTCNSTGR